MARLSISMSKLDEKFAKSVARVEHIWSPEPVPEMFALSQQGSVFARFWQEMTPEVRIAVANSIEEALMTDDDTLRTDVTTGFLESLVNVSLHQSAARLDEVKGYFGPRASQTIWNLSHD